MSETNTIGQYEHYEKPFTLTTIPAPYDKKGLEVFDTLNDQGVNYVKRSIRTYLVNEGLTKEAAYQELEHDRDVLSERLLELTEHGVQVAPTYFQPGKNEYDNPSLFVMTRDLGAENVFNSKFDSPEESEAAIPQFTALVTGLSSYFAKKIDAGEPFLDDIDSLRQYVFTSIDDTTESAFFLVDTEPRTAPSSEPRNLKDLVANLRLMVEGMEMRLPGGTVLEKCRDQLIKLMDVIVAKHPELEEDLKPIAQGLMSGYNGVAAGERIEQTPMEDTGFAEANTRNTRTDYIKQYHK